MQARGQVGEVHWGAHRTLLLVVATLLTEVWGRLIGLERAPEAACWHMMKGYINADSGFDADGYWDSGDVFERQHNKLFYKSRKKDLIKVNSFNISPVSVENAISLYPGILEVCVTFRSRDMGEKEIVALVRPEDSINTSELISFVKEKLFAYEIPKEIIIVEEPLVRNRMGKIQREANREKFVI